MGLSFNWEGEGSSEESKGFSFFIGNDDDMWERDGFGFGVCNEGRMRRRKD